MKLVVIDANIIFAALLNPRGTNCDLIFSPVLEFISPEFLEAELKKHLPLIIQKSGRSEIEVKTALDLILSRIKIIPDLEYERYRKQAHVFSPDPDDSEYFAVALKFDCLLWSNDKKLKEQGKVKVLSTSELLQILS